MSVLVEPQTARLCLRQWTDADSAPFFEMNADPRVMEFLSSPMDRRASDQLAERCRSRIDQRGWGFWAVETRKGQRLIGFVGLEETGPDLPFSPCVEIGWRLAFEHWGRGFATEAAEAALRVGFEEVGLSEIVSFTSVANVRSRAVMERLGMRVQPETFQHPRVPIDSPLREHCLYRLSAEGWEKGR